MKSRPSMIRTLVIDDGWHLYVAGRSQSGTALWMSDPADAFVFPSEREADEFRHTLTLDPHYWRTTIVPADRIK